MKSQYLLIGVLLGAVACSGSGGGGGSSSAKNDSISPEPSGNLKIESESGIETISNSCQTDKLDSKIKVGFTQRISFNIFSQDTGRMDLNKSYVVKSVDQSAKTFVTSMSYGPSNEETTCRLTSEGALCEGASPTPSNTDFGGDQSCEIRDAGEFNFSGGRGMLTLKGDGKTISVRQSKMSITGNLFCNKKDTGKTATEKVTILTPPDVLSLDLVRGVGCSGIAFMYRQITDSSGVVRSTMRQELISQSTL